MIMEEIDKTHAILTYGVCSACGINPGSESHTCPFAEEIHEDYISECNCCNNCCKECAEDI